MAWDREVDRPRCPARQRGEGSWIPVGQIDETGSIMGGVLGGDRSVIYRSVIYRSVISHVPFHCDLFNRSKDATSSFLLSSLSSHLAAILPPQ